MKTWEEIRDEVAGMLADGQPLEDIISKLEQRKNEMAKAELIAVVDELKKLKPQTNEKYIRSCSTEELVKMILDMCEDKPCFACGIGYCDDENWCHVYSDEAREFVLEWLKEKHE